MQFRYFLIAALAVATLNITNVNAMEQALQVAETNEVVMRQLYSNKIAELTTFLKENRQNPEAVIELIDQLLEDYGHNKSVNLLKIALADAQMWIGDIKHGMLVMNCLNIICSKKDRDACDLDCIRIILCVADDRAINLIAPFDDSVGFPALHFAILHGHDDIIDIFINWAMAKNMIKALLSSKVGNQSTVLHSATLTGRARILKTLLALAYKYGMVKELINAKNDDGNTALDYASRPWNAQIREEMISIVKEYSIKYQFAPGMSLT